MKTDKTLLLSGSALTVMGTILFIITFVIVEQNEAQTSTLDRAAIPPKGSASLSNSNIEAGKEMLVFVDTRDTSVSNDTLKLQLIEPDGSILLERDFEHSMMVYPVAQQSGNHTAIITSMEDAPIVISAVMKLRLSPLFDIPWGLLIIAGLAILIPTSIKSLKKRSAKT